MARPKVINPAKIAGVYRGAGSTGVAGVKEWEQWLGQKVYRILDFIPNDNWGSLEAPFNSFWNDRSSPYAANGGERITMGLPLVPDSNTGGSTNPGTDPPTLAQSGAGTYSPHWSRLADFLAARGLNKVTFRPGNEYNGVWGLAWQPSTGGGTEADFAAAYRNCVTTMRNRATTIGFEQNWKFEYSLATSDNGGGITLGGASYPGDSYWDYLSVNCYDESYSGENTETRWANLLTRTPATGGPGLNYVRDFVISKGKSMAFGELGTVWHPSATNYTTPDTPEFLQHAYDWISDATNRVAYWNWWDGSPTWVYRILQRDPTVVSKPLPKYRRQYRNLISRYSLGNRAPYTTTVQ